MNFGKIKLAARLTVLVGVAAILTACAGMWQLDTNVQTASTLRSVPTQATFQFERTPLQRPPLPYSPGQGFTQDGIEKATADELVKYGLVPASSSASAKYSVNVKALVYYVQSPNATDFPDPLYNGPYRMGPQRRPFTPRFADMERPYYGREITITIRDMATGQVVYETHGENDGPRHDSQNILNGMIAAALVQFPTPPEGIRRVNTEIPR